MKKIISFVSGLCMLAGLLIVLCTAGASDAYALDFKSVIVRTLIGLGVLFIGFAGGKLSKVDYVY